MGQLCVGHVSKGLFYIFISINFHLGVVIFCYVSDQMNVDGDDDNALCISIVSLMRLWKFLVASIYLVLFDFGHLSNLEFSFFDFF